MKTPYETLEGRVAYLTAFTKGKMPVCMVVADEAEKTQAEALLKGKRNGTLVLVQTRTEFNAERPEHLQERH